MLARTGERLARALRPLLAPLMGGRQPVTRAALDAPELPGLAAHSLLLSEGQAVPLLVSVEGAAILALTDRAFGGPGEVPKALPAELPMAADLMAARIEGLVAQALAAALDRPAGAIESLRRDASLAQLAPFPDDIALSRIGVTVEEPGQTPWAITVTLPSASLAALFGAGETPATRRSAAPYQPTDLPFADLPLPVRAVMAEVELPVAAVAALAVGQVLPVAVARIVPLQVSGRIIARGTVGAVDDRVAVQITRLA